MKILCKSKSSTVTVTQQVNKIGKYLYENIDGAFKFEKSTNTCDVFFTLLYQLPIDMRDPDKGEEYNDVHEIEVDINITTYQNKIRVNVIEITPQARTLGYDLYEPELLQDLESARSRIFKRVVKRVSRAYSEYDFIF